MKFHQIMDKKDGKLLYDATKFKALTDMLFDGRYLVSFQRLNPLSSTTEYRRCYFAKVDAIAFETGETRYNTHMHLKTEILNKMVEETPKIFTIPMPEPSTGYLSLEGWLVFIERVDIFAFVHYNIIL